MKVEITIAVIIVGDIDLFVVGSGTAAVGVVRDQQRVEYHCMPSS